MMSISRFECFDFRPRFDFLPHQELETAALIREICGEGFPLTLSHTVGGTGFIERENSALLNPALKKVMTLGFKGLRAVCASLELSYPLYVTQNIGCQLPQLARAFGGPQLTLTDAAISAGHLTISNAQRVMEPLEAGSLIGSGGYSDSPSSLCAEPNGAGDCSRDGKKCLDRIDWEG